MVVYIGMYCEINANSENHTKKLSVFNILCVCIAQILKVF